MKTKFFFSELPTCSMGLSEYSQGLRIWPPIKKFSEIPNKLFFKNLKFPTLYLGTIRVLSRFANLASNYDCSSFCVLKFSRYDVFVIFSKFFRKLNFECFFNLKFLTLYLGAARVLPGVVNLASKYDYSNTCTFRDLTFSR